MSLFRPKRHAGQQFIQDLKSGPAGFKRARAATLREKQSIHKVDRETPAYTVYIYNK